MSDEGKDTRQLVLFERMLGNYIAAGAIYSYGDAYGFFDGDKKGVVIADTCGHIKEFGDEMQIFLNHTITDGWGVSGDAVKEVLDLGPRLVQAGTGKPHFKQGKSHNDYDEWWSCLAVNYMSLDRDDVQLSGYFNYIFRRNMDVEHHATTLCPFHHYERPFHDPKGIRTPIQTRLDEMDILLVSSDGLVSNIGRSLYKAGRSCKENDVQEMISGCVFWDRHRTAVGIRNAIVFDISSYFLPQIGSEDALAYDDVTFVVFKKK